MTLKKLSNNTVKNIIPNHVKTTVSWSNLKNVFL